MQWRMAYVEQRPALPKLLTFWRSMKPGRLWLSAIPSVGYGPSYVGGPDQIIACVLGDPSEATGRQLWQARPLA